jgi:hypothetical protein
LKEFVDDLLKFKQKENSSRVEKVTALLIEAKLNKQKLTTADDLTTTTRLRLDPPPHTHTNTLLDSETPAAAGRRGRQGGREQQ